MVMSTERTQLARIVRQATQFARGGDFNSALCANVGMALERWVQHGLVEQETAAAFWDALVAAGLELAAAGMDATINEAARAAKQRNAAGRGRRVAAGNGGVDESAQPELPGIPGAVRANFALAGVTPGERRAELKRRRDERLRAARSGGVLAGARGGAGDGGPCAGGDEGEVR